MKEYIKSRSIVGSHAEAHQKEESVAKMSKRVEKDAEEKSLTPDSEKMKPDTRSVDERDTRDYIKSSAIVGSHEEVHQKVVANKEQGTAPRVSLAPDEIRKVADRSTSRKIEPTVRPAIHSRGSNEREQRPPEKIVERSAKPEQKKKMHDLLRAAIGGGMIIGGGLAAEDIYRNSLNDSIDTPPILLKLAADKTTTSIEQFSAMKRALPDRLVFTVALLAHDTTPRYEAFNADPALAHVDEVSRSLVLPLVRHKKVGPEFWEGLSDEFIHNDAKTADVRLDLLKTLSDKYGGAEPVELEESAAYVARNLFMKGVNPTVESVKTEVQAILERREAFAEEDLFKENILLVSGDEVWKENLLYGLEPRFGKEVLEAALKERQHKAGNSNSTFSHVTPLFKDASGYHSTSESVRQAKAIVLESIALSHKPLTVFFDGHGGYGNFYLSTTMKNDGRETINVTELADALTQRWQSAQTEDPSVDLKVSLLFDDCMMQSFIRDLGVMLASRNVPLPRIMISASEFDQYSFSDSGEFGSKFGELLVKSPDLKTVIEQKHDIKSPDPSMFVPRHDDPTKLMQMSGIVVANFPSVG